MLVAVDGSVGCKSGRDAHWKKKLGQMSCPKNFILKNSIDMMCMKSRIFNFFY